MSSSPPAAAPRSRAALNAAIRRLSAGRVDWPAPVLAELVRLQAEYVAAEREEAALGRGDVAEVA